MQYCYSALPQQARRTSLPVSRDSRKRRKSSAIGQLKSQTIMPDDHPEITVDSNTCVKCDAQKSIGGSKNSDKKVPVGDMAFSAIVIGGGVLPIQGANAT